MSSVREVMTPESSGIFPYLQVIVTYWLLGASIVLELFVAAGSGG
ncbi:hypothetical protein [Paenibacillus alvei]|nr:hypothetical protein [Paenibacillus alvei]